MFSALTVAVVQGALTICGVVFGSFMPDSLIAAMTAAGGALAGDWHSAAATERSSCCRHAPRSCGRSAAHPHHRLFPINHADRTCYVSGLSLDERGMGWQKYRGVRHAL